MDKDGGFTIARSLERISKQGVVDFVKTKVIDDNIISIGERLILQTIQVEGDIKFGTDAFAEIGGV